MDEGPLLRVEELAKHFPVGRRPVKGPRAWVKAVDGVSFSIHQGECFGLVGESGCGKTTVGRLILRLMEPTAGRLRFKGKDLLSLNRNELRRIRRSMQIIFQDPYSSLDPRMKVASIVSEPLKAFEGLSRRARRDRAAELLQRVGLNSGDLDKYPHEFSGGQRQRIGIARALAVQPELIVADEPVSALDVSIQAQVINLLEDLRGEYGLSYLFISHDLSVVEHVCERIGVMYLGRLVELAPTDCLFGDPRHPYTRALLDAVPVPDPHKPMRLEFLEGDVPNPISPPAGCSFHPRCRHAMAVCRVKRPALVPLNEEHLVACWLDEGRGLAGESP